MIGSENKAWITKGLPTVITLLVVGIILLVLFQSTSKETVVVLTENISR